MAAEESLLLTVEEQKVVDAEVEALWADIDSRKPLTKIAEVAKAFISHEKKTASLLHNIVARIAKMKEMIRQRDKGIADLKQLLGNGNINIEEKLRAINPAEINASIATAVDTAVKNIPAPVIAADVLTSEKIKDEVEAAWVEVVSGKRKKAGVIPMSKVVKEQIQQQNLAEERKTNVVLHNFKPEENHSYVDLFLEVVDVCGLKTEVSRTDVISVKRMRRNEGQANETIQPVIVELASEEKKHKLLKKLSIWREVQRNERDPNDASPWKNIDHDYTKEQREEKKLLLEDAKKLNDDEPENSHFRYRVRGIPTSLKMVKVDTRTGRWVE